MSEQLQNAIVELQQAECSRLAERLLESGTDPQKILDTSIKAMAEIGERFENEEYFLVELLMAGEIMEHLMALVLPYMDDGPETARAEVIVLGTVRGDIHDLGKNLVRFMLEANGYFVHDLGVDVSPERFVEAAEETGASIVGLSALLTSSYESLKETVAVFERSGLRGRVKLMIGGAPVDERVLTYAGADALGKSAVHAVALANAWTEQSSPTKS